MTKPRTRELCDLVDFYSGGTPARSNEKFWDGDVPWVSGKDMKQFRLDGSQEHITNHAVEKGARCLDPGAILVLVRGMALFKGVPTGILTCRAAFNQDIKALVARDGVNPTFLAYAVAARQNILQSFVTAAGHGTGRLITEALETLPIWIPEEDLQAEIVEALRTWDDAIVIAEKLAGEKKARLTWLTDRLIFEIDHRRPIREVAEQTSMRAGEKFEEFDVFSCTKHDGLVLSDEYFSKQVYGEDRANYKVVRPLELAYATNHIEEGSIGLNNHGRAGIVSPMYTVFRATNIAPEFLISVLKTERMRREFERRTPASVNRRGGLRWDDFSEIEIPSPDPVQQENIQTVLKTARLEVEAAEVAATKLREQQSGLLQRLLKGNWRDFENQHGSTGRKERPHFDGVEK